MRKIAILGSTGSIGRQTLDECARHPELFEVTALTAHSRAEELFDQIRRFRPKMACLTGGLPVEPPDDIGFCRFYPPEQLETLARDCDADDLMVAVVGVAGLRATLAGRRAGKRVTAVVSDMNEPLGHAVGNALEVKEALAALRGEYAGDLTELCYALGAQILLESELADGERAARAMLKQTIDDGSALERFRRFVAAQGGAPAAVDDPSLLPTAPVQKPVLSDRAGYIQGIDAHGVGLVSMQLGGGRASKEDEIDLSVGVVLNKKAAEYAEAGEALGTIHARTEADADAAAERLRACFTLSDEPVERAPFIKGVVR